VALPADTNRERPGADCSSGGLPVKVDRRRPCWGSLSGIVAEKVEAIPGVETIVKPKVDELMAKLEGLVHQ
jgi:hypothetical protein